MFKTFLSTYVVFLYIFYCVLAFSHKYLKKCKLLCFSKKKDLLYHMHQKKFLGLEKHVQLLPFVQQFFYILLKKHLRIIVFTHSKTSSIKIIDRQIQREPSFGILSLWKYSLYLLFLHKILFQFLDILSCIQAQTHFPNYCWLCPRFFSIFSSNSSPFVKKDIDLLSSKSLLYALTFGIITHNGIA